jgi:hypothetical protein
MRQYRRENSFQLQAEDMRRSRIVGMTDTRNGVDVIFAGVARPKVST